MAKADFIKRPDRQFAQQMLTFKNNIGSYSATLGLTAGEVAAQAADALRYAWELDCKDICDQCSQSWTSWKNITRGGGAYPVAGSPVEMALPTPAPSAVAPGIEDRFRKLCGKIKKHPNYNPSVGEALGIEGVEITGPDLATVKPQFPVTVTAGGVALGWTWGGNSQFLDAIEIQVDRGDGQGFRFLTIDTTPGYTDSQAFPATPQKWTYRAVYRVGDQRVGQWSDPVSVNVGG